MRPANCELAPYQRGLNFARTAIALAAAQGLTDSAAEIAAARWGVKSLPHIALRAGGPDFLLLEKAAIPAGSVASATWGEALAGYEGAATEFFDLVRSESLIGKLGLRRVPIRTRLVAALTGFAAAWVAEGRAVPVSGATFYDGELPGRKMAGMAVISRELIDSFDPAAEVFVRDELIKALTAAIDTTFISPENAGEDGVEPASVTHGAVSIPATGDGLADIRALIQNFPGDLSRAVLVGSPTTFAALHDPFTLPRLGVRGGEALGIEAVPSVAAGSTLALIDPDGIAFGESDLNLRTSSEGTVEMVDNPLASSTTPSPTTTISLFQTGSTALLAEKRLNWATVRPSVSLITGVGGS